MVVKTSFDIIVLGIGAMGASACHHLARRGARVLGLEQFDIPHTLGSSHGMSRMIRMAYFEHPDYVPLLKRAYELWEELERLTGQTFLHITGGLYMGKPECELVAGSLAAAQKHELPHQLLSRDEVALKFPQFALPENHVALFEPRAGFLQPEKVVAAYARTALHAGAELHGREPVREWSADSSGVSVRTDLAEYRARKLVFCAGPWTGKLLREFAERLVVTRQVMLWFGPRDPSMFELGKLPVWAIDRPAGGLYYGFPVFSDDVGLKVACHAPGAPTDPDQVMRDPLPGDLEEVRAAMRAYLPDGDGPILSQRVCMYTNSLDSHFIIDLHPANPDGRVILACGFSGHGFKFASVVGEVLADLALEGKTRWPIGFLNAGRVIRYNQG
jgi:sarcosine oxidase